MNTITAIVGLDLSLTSTGVAVIDPCTVPPISVSRIRTAGKRSDTWAQRHARLGGIVDRITDHVPPGALVMIEGPAYSRSVGSVHDRSGLWWLAYTALVQHDCTIAVCPIQARIRYAVGKGAAHKDIVLSAVVRRYGAMLPELTGNDEADALLMAALGARWLGYPVEPQPLSKLCLKALDALGPSPYYTIGSKAV